MKIAAIYARVSSDRQKEDQTIASQTAALRAYAAEVGLEVPADWIFEDEGISGATLLRPALERLRDLVAQLEVPVLLCYSPDRLARKYAYQALLMEEFARSGTEVQFLKGPKADTPEDELLLQFQGMIAEYEKAQISERTRRGKVHRARSGSPAVLSGAPYGYRYVRKREHAEAQYEILEPEATVVRELFRRYTEDVVSIGELARSLTVQGIPTAKGKRTWDRSTVWGILRNPAYCGRAAFGKTRVTDRVARVTRPVRLKGIRGRRRTADEDRPREDWIEIAVPALVSDDVFEAAQRRLQENKHFSARNTKEPSLLQGLVACQSCGYGYYRTSTRTRARKLHYYRCLGSDDYRYENGRICANRPVRQDYLDDVVWQHITALLSDPRLIRVELDRRLEEVRKADPAAAQRSRVELQLVRGEKAVRRLVDAYQAEIVTLEELRERMPKLRREDAALRAQLADLEAQQVDRETYLKLAEGLEDFLIRLRESAERPSMETRQRTVRLLVKEVLVGPERVVIRHSIPTAPSGPTGGYLLRGRGPRCPLWRAFFALRPRPFLQDTRAHPFLDETDDPAICNSEDPQLAALIDRGREHERGYVESRTVPGTRTVDLSEVTDADVAARRTLAAMRSRADTIVQGALSVGAWRGRPDVLVKVATPSRLGDWSYEVEDTKLAREPRADAILQLGLYCELLELAQGKRPEHFRIITPHGSHPFRVDDFAAYFRWIRAALERTSESGAEALLSASYPEPCDHCDVCPWIRRCDARRRADDHLSLVAGISRLQRKELQDRGIDTLRALAELPLPLPFKPSRGAKETYERVREQARLQLESRRGELVFELLDVEPEQGLCRLPEPTPGDIFLDLEGAPFAGEVGAGGREYLFGVVTVGANGPIYHARWADSLEGEKRAFETLIDLIESLRAAHPTMHVYHYAPYEPSALKRLMGRHATRENEIDALLRSQAFVDLYAVVRRGVRAGVERYSIKNLEPLYGYTREVELKDARSHLQAIELACENDSLADVDPAVRTAVEGYNRDDCVSALRLRDWLEQQRAELIDRGAEIPRPALQPGAPTEELDKRQLRVAALRARLLQVVDRARYLLAYMLDYHRREDKSTWWEYFRLRDLSEEDLLDERAAVAGLAFERDMGPLKKSRRLRFSYPEQELEIRAGATLKLREDKSWGEVVEIDRIRRTIDVKIGPGKVDLRPPSAFTHTWVDPKVMEEALCAIGEGVVNDDADPLALELLHAHPPRSRDVTQLRDSVLAIQGPPGSGKTYTGGTMICKLVQARKKVGVMAASHKVIANLLRSVAHEADRLEIAVRLARKLGSGEDAEEAEAAGVHAIEDNAEARAALEANEIDVLGGTVWLWASPELRKQVDVLFIDEAGQMSLANALAATQAAHGLVLLGDPQQLDQPRKGVHPEGVAISVLEHMLAGHKTMPEDRGMFLARTRRFGPAICAFTSEVFYENKLEPWGDLGLEKQRLTGGPIEGAGLFFIDVEHEGNVNAADEEADVVARWIERLLARGSRWVSSEGVATQVTATHILVVSPYNAQVARITERVSDGVEVGTVDKFQGRQAPIVLYSMTTSSQELAPRGMEFLYSLNRLNVATSRAQCAAIVIASPRLYEPDCKSPRQMQLANALCRLRELAKPLDLDPRKRA